MKTLLHSIRKSVYSILTILFLLTTVSCSKDFLDLKNTNDLTSDNFFKTPKDFEYAIRAVYGSAGALRDEDIQHLNVQQARGGESELAVGVSNFFNYTNDVTNALSDNLYAGLYTMIYRANTVLYEMELNPDVKWDSDRQKELISAQAYFFRGLGYFYLAHSFGEVPIVTRPAFTEEERTPFKATIPEVYDQAIADLKLAKAGLDERPEVVGTASKGAATGFLGKTYLYRASYLEQNEYYALAAAEFREVMNMGIYGLVTDYADNFTDKNENNIESLFELQYLYAPELDDVPAQYRGIFSVPGIAEQVVMRPSQWLMETMGSEKDVDGNYDIRYLETVYFDGGLDLFGVPYNQLCGGMVIVDGDHYEGSCPDGSGNTEGGYWRKYLNVSDDFQVVTYDRGANNNERILRYADILLMFAEAEIMSGGSLVEASAAVKQVRDRANLANKTWSSYDALMTEIKHQRIMEFTYENMLYFDLIRWGDLGAAIQDHGNAVQKASYDAEKHKYFPLPLADILANKNLKQNPEWE